jgi:hypothetical protein
MLLSGLIKGNRKTKKKAFSNTKGMSLNLALFSLTLSGVFAASITIGVIELGRGVGSTESCIDSLRITFNHSTPTDENTTITGLSLSGVNDGCSGRWLMVRLLGSSGQAIDEVVWQVSQGTTSLSTTQLNADLASNTVVGVEYLLSDVELVPAV